MHFSRSTRAGLVLALLCLFSPNSLSSDSRLSGERTTFARPSFADATAALVRTSPTKTQAAQTHERDGNDEEDVPLTRPKKRTFRSLSLPNHRRNKRVKQVLQWGALGLAVLALAASAGFASRPEAPKAALEVQRVRKTDAETRRKGAQQKDKQAQTVEQKGLFRSFERSFIDTVKKPALNVRRTVDDTHVQSKRQILEAA
ncbi:putative transmembrane protein [Toxoplasma gondii RUB]|uniref:Putative transmembrane protein n=1 Tax=Toxoplasma gondii RUB TaxID=935652 RepID=A0A086M8G6_TOXGO|nr:putative transmembrane protein [Toxoplasma gondii RUB]